jgi:hypothetical protein
MARAALHDQPLRLRAEDAEDLAVFAAMLQDATVRVGDLAFLPRAHRFVGVATRFCWEHGLDARLSHRFGIARVRAGFHFDTVRAVRARSIAQNQPDSVLSLLTITAEPISAGVAISLVCAGGGEIRIEAEAVEAHLRDMGPLWYSRHCPHHPVEPDGLRHS